MKFKIGVIFIFIAAIIPIVVGCTLFIKSVLPYSAMLEIYSLPFSIMHFGFLMLPMECIIILVLTYKFTYQRKYWSWLVTLLFFSFVGIGDLIGSFMTKGFPFPIAPLSFGLIGLLLIKSDMVKE